MLDVLDTCRTWLAATVIAKSSHPVNSVKIHYTGYSDRWDEYINVGDPRLAPYKSKYVYVSLSLSLFYLISYLISIYILYLLILVKLMNVLIH